LVARHEEDNDEYIETDRFDKMALKMLTNLKKEMNNISSQLRDIRSEIDVITKAGNSNKQLSIALGNYVYTNFPICTPGPSNSISSTKSQLAVCLNPNTTDNRVDSILSALNTNFSNFLVSSMDILQGLMCDLL